MTARGFAIGFSTNHLRWLAKNLRGSLADVVYEDADQDALIEKAFEVYPRLCDGEDPTIEEAAGEILGRILWGRKPLQEQIVLRGGRMEAGVRTSFFMRSRR